MRKVPTSINNKKVLIKLSSFLSRKSLPLISLLLMPVLSLAAEPAFVNLPDTISLALGEEFQLDLELSSLNDEPVVFTVDGLPAWMEAKKTDDLLLNYVETLDVLPDEYESIYDMESDAEGNLFLSLLHANKGFQVVKLSNNSELSILAEWQSWGTKLTKTSNDRVHYLTFYSSDDPDKPGESKRYSPIMRLNENKLAEQVAEIPYLVNDMVADSKGNIFLLASVSNRCDGTHVLRLNQDGQVTLFAGSKNLQGYDYIYDQKIRDGFGAGALFACTQHIAIDEYDNLFLSDIKGNLRKLSPIGLVSTLPEVDYVLGNYPTHIKAITDAGYYFIGDRYIFLRSKTGVVTRFAGSHDFSVLEPIKDGIGINAIMGPIAAAEIMPDGDIYTAERILDKNYRQIGYKFRKVQFSVESLSGKATNASFGVWPLIISAHYGDKTITKQISISVLNKLNLNGQLISDVQIEPNMHIYGGNLNGDIIGYADAPALITDAEIRSYSTVDNVVVGKGVGVSFLIDLLNVKFEDNKDIPIGLELTHAFGKKRPSNPAYFSLSNTVDLNSSILLHSTTLLEQIKALSPAFSAPGAIKTDDDGQLIYTNGDERHYYEAFYVEQGDAQKLGLKQGINYDELSLMVLYTQYNRSVYLRPVLENVDALADALEEKDLLLAYNSTGVYYAFSDRSYLPVAALRPIAASKPAREGLTIGLHQLPQLKQADFSYYVLVYELDGELREQELYPAPFSPLLFYDMSFSAFFNLPILSQKGIVTIGNSRFIPAVNLRPSNNKTGIYDMGDINSDGLRDYQIVYSSYRISQLLYSLPAK